MFRMTKLFSAILILECVIPGLSSIYCKDENGEDVPTWSILKLPRGTNYYYYDVNNELSLSSHSLNATSLIDGGALAHTLQNLWSNPNINYIMYNDEPPYQLEYNMTVGHSKGVWMWDTDNAVLLTHSIPKFPVGPKMATEYIGLLENAWDYGQSMMCAEFSLSALKTALSALSEEIPLIYEEQGSLLSIPNKITSSQNVVCNVQQLDNNYIMFVKESTDNVDIWSDCIAEYFETEMQVESWVHGELEGSYCPPDVRFKTVDIKSVNFGDGNEFVEYDDHSKWGLGVSPLVCFGDMNRVVTQKKRGGSTYCWKDTTLWSNMNAIINSTSIC